MNISKNSWHYRLLLWWNNDRYWAMPDSLCSYVRQICLVSFLTLFAGVFLLGVTWVACYTIWAILKYPIYSIISGNSLYEVIWVGNYTLVDYYPEDTSSAVAYVLTLTGFVLMVLYGVYIVFRWILEFLSYSMYRVRNRHPKEGSFMDVINNYYLAVMDGICPTLNYVDGEKENGNKN